jgi:hypothetical protein
LSTIIDDSERLRQMGQAGQTWYEAQYRNERPALTHLYERVAPT